MKQSINLSTGVGGSAVANAIRSNYNLNAVPKLVAEWNLNRYTSPVVTNTPDEDTNGFDIESFPIESIVEPLRPKKGSAKARVNESVVSAGYLRHNSPKFYISSPDDKYKYWTSPVPTNGSGNFPDHTDGLTVARPRVVYDREIQANKIVITFENTWASPKFYSVMLKSTLGGSFSQIGGANPAIDGATGTLTLYYNGTAWVSTRPAVLVATSVRTIELRVTAMGPGIKKNGQIMTYTNKPTAGGDLVSYSTTGANSSLNVIAIEPRLETDLTDRLINVSDNFDMADQSDLYPLGTITTNGGTITLSNEDGIFNAETNGIYKDLIDANVEFNLEYIYTIGTTQHSVQQFKLYGGEWSQSEGTVDISLEDYSKYLKEIKPNSFMVEGKSSTEIVWRVLDSVGFNNYEIQEEDTIENSLIPVFWTDNEQTVWEQLDELSKATQTAIYFDSYGKLQVRAREAAFKDTAVNWNLLGDSSGGNLSDIISWEPSAEFEANKIDVKYRTTKWKTASTGVAAMTKVWEPDGETVVVRSSALKQTINNSSTHVYMDQKDIELWPYKTKVQIDGEIIECEGKQFVYFTYTETVGGNGLVIYSAPVRNVVNVESLDEYNKFNRKTPGPKRFQNHFTGGLKIVNRAVWNSDQQNHNVDLNGWSTRLETGGSVRDTPNGMSHNKSESLLHINTPDVMSGAGDTFWAVRGGPASSGYKTYGTRFRISGGGGDTTKTVGFAFQLSGANEQGYYVQVAASANAPGQEVKILSKKGGTNTLISGGAATAIGVGIWYDLDIYHSGSGNSQRINVFINGQKVASGTTNSSTAHSDSGRFGLFAKGQTSADFEYIYAVARNVVEPEFDYGFYDLKYGGIRGGQWEKEHVWETRTRKRRVKKKNSTKEKYKHNMYLFDEFGPYIHEVREFDVKFDPYPVRYSYLFNTNEWFSTVVEYYGNPFGAKFVIANSGRIHAVIKGEDKLVYAGAASGVNQVCVVLGHALEIADEETVTRKNEAAIRARGEIVSELSSDWIQSKDLAKSLAEWMNNHWSDSVDEVNVEVFGNPLIEIGDIVDVNYDRYDLAPDTHKYFVVGTANSFEAGIKTTLTLRRKR